MAVAGAVSIKSPEAFRTISEVAEVLDVPQHVLRFWETRFSQIRPVKRAGGRRFYRPEDVDLLRGIRLLLYFEGYTIKGVQKILREKGVRHAVALGRQDALAQGEPKRAERIEPRDAENSFAALAMLARAHDDAAETIAKIANANDADGAPEPCAKSSAPEGDPRARLEDLLAELTTLKTRIAAARAAARP
jgi:DNA-binding transcriptional MerR regulator